MLGFQLASNPNLWVPANSTCQATGGGSSVIRQMSTLETNPLSHKSTHIQKNIFSKCTKWKHCKAQAWFVRQMLITAGMVVLQLWPQKEPDCFSNDYLPPPSFSDIWRCWHYKANKPLFVPGRARSFSKKKKIPREWNYLSLAPNSVFVWIRRKISPGGVYPTMHHEH